MWKDGVAFAEVSVCRMVERLMDVGSKWNWWIKGNGNDRLHVPEALHCFCLISTYG